jgi:phosphatidylglycerophosphate synthase
MTEDKERAPIVRIQQNLLAKSERRLLTWLCARMPGWVRPDLLTAIGLIGSAIIFAGYAASSFHPAWLWLAIGGYFVQWFGDSMDGSLARYRKIERPAFGYFIDHSCDGFATMLIMTGIGLSPYVRLDVALVALTGYLLLAIHAFLSARVLDELKLSYVAFGPTELRLVLIAVSLAMMVLGSGPGMFGAISGFDVVVGSVGLLLIGLFVIQTLATARRLANQEAGRRRGT